MVNCHKLLFDYRDTVIILLTPVILSPLLFSVDYESEYKCAYVVVLMAIYWVFEVLPLAITALIPMVLFPCLGIMKSDKVAKMYLPDTGFLFIGGLMVAVAVEKSNLHTRIALAVLAIVGSDPKFIMLGFMGVTAFLSMWISNTATAALMVPIVQSVITELVSNHRAGELSGLMEKSNLASRRRSLEGRRLSMTTDPTTMIREQPKDMCKYFSPRELRMSKGLLISVCYAANIGGAATITGTASNLVFVGQLEKLFPGADTGINFLSWIVFAAPMCAMCLVCCWLILCVIFLRGCPKGNAAVSRKLKEKYDRLPNISFAEKMVTICFSFLLFLWVMREPKVVPGVGSLFKKGYVTDATSAVLVVIILFILPEKWPNFHVHRRAGERHKGLLDWSSIQDNFPWAVVILLGGGFALAAGVKESDLSQMIGDMMKTLGSLPNFFAMSICVLITVALTNICSNTVVASIFTPIVAELARSLEINPLMFMLPVTVGSSFAFLLPVATPPNAIVFGAGVIEVKDMAIAGFLVTLCCTVVNIANMWIMAVPLLALNEFPEWAYTNEQIAGNATSLIVEMFNATFIRN